MRVTCGVFACNLPDMKASARGSRRMARVVCLAFVVLWLGLPVCCAVLSCWLVCCNFII